MSNKTEETKVVEAELEKEGSLFNNVLSKKKKKKKKRTEQQKLEKALTKESQKLEKQAKKQEAAQQQLTLSQDQQQQQILDSSKQQIDGQDGIHQEDSDQENEEAEEGKTNKSQIDSSNKNYFPNNLAVQKMDSSPYVDEDNVSSPLHSQQERASVGSNIAFFQSNISKKNSHIGDGSDMSTGKIAVKPRRAKTGAKDYHHGHKFRTDERNDERPAQHLKIQLQKDNDTFSHEEGVINGSNSVKDLVLKFSIGQNQQEMDGGDYGRRTAGTAKTTKFGDRVAEQHDYGRRTAGNEPLSIRNNFLLSVNGGSSAGGDNDYQACKSQGKWTVDSSQKNKSNLGENFLQAVKSFQPRDDINFRVNPKRQSPSSNKSASKNNSCSHQSQDNQGIIVREQAAQLCIKNTKIQLSPDTPPVTKLQKQSDQEEQKTPITASTILEQQEQLQISGKLEQNGENSSTVKDNIKVFSSAKEHQSFVSPQAHTRNPNKPSAEQHHIDTPQIDKNQMAQANLLMSEKNTATFHQQQDKELIFIPIQKDNMKQSSFNYDEKDVDQELVEKNEYQPAIAGEAEIIDGDDGLTPVMETYRDLIRSTSQTSMSPREELASASLSINQQTFLSNEDSAVNKENTRSSDQSMLQSTFQIKSKRQQQFQGNQDIKIVRTDDGESNQELNSGTFDDANDPRQLNNILNVQRCSNATPEPYKLQQYFRQSTDENSELTVFGVGKDTQYMNQSSKRSEQTEDSNNNRMQIQHQQQQQQQVGLWAKNNLENKPINKNSKDTKEAEKGIDNPEIQIKIPAPSQTQASATTEKSIIQSTEQTCELPEATVETVVAQTEEDAMVCGTQITQLTIKKNDSYASSKHDGDAIEVDDVGQQTQITIVNLPPEENSFTLPASEDQKDASQDNRSQNSSHKLQPHAIEETKQKVLADTSFTTRPSLIPRIKAATRTTSMSSGSEVKTPPKATSPQATLMARSRNSAASAQNSMIGLSNQMSNRSIFQTKQQSVIMKADSSLSPNKQSRRSSNSNKSAEKRWNFSPKVVQQGYLTNHSGSKKKAQSNVLAFAQQAQQVLRNKSFNKSRVSRDDNNISLTDFQQTQNIIQFAKDEKANPHDTEQTHVQNDFDTIHKLQQYQPSASNEDVNGNTLHDNLIIASDDVAWNKDNDRDCLDKDDDRDCLDSHEEGKGSVTQNFQNRSIAHLLASDITLKQDYRQDVTDRQEDDISKVEANNSSVFEKQFEQEQRQEAGRQSLGSLQTKQQKFMDQQRYLVQQDSLQSAGGQQLSVRVESDNRSVAQKIELDHEEPQDEDDELDDQDGDLLSSHEVTIAASPRISTGHNRSYSEFMKINSKKQGVPEDNFLFQENSNRDRKKSPSFMVHSLRSQIENAEMRSDNSEEGQLVINRARVKEMHQSIFITYDEKNKQQLVSIKYVSAGTLDGQYGSNQTIEEINIQATEKDLRFTNPTQIKKNFMTASARWPSMKQLENANHSNSPLVVSLEEQEVLCSNCYDTIPMREVDTHSESCFKEELKSIRLSLNHRYTTQDVDYEYNNTCDELNQRLFKLIETLLRKLNSQKYLDQFYTTHRHAEESIVDGDLDSVRLIIIDESASRGRQAAAMQSPIGSPIGTPWQSTTALQKEIPLIKEIVQNAQLALQSNNVKDVKEAAEKLDRIESEQNLNLRFDFNNHMVYNRIVQVINIKLAVMRDWQVEHELFELSTTTPLNNQAQVRELRSSISAINHNRISKGFTAEKLRIHDASQDVKDDIGLHHPSNQNQQDSQLTDQIFALKAQAMQRLGNKPLNTVIVEKRKSASAYKTSGGNKQNYSGGIQEHWILSDICSDEPFNDHQGVSHNK